jgi:hypothetical protein
MRAVPMRFRNDQYKRIRFYIYGLILLGLMGFVLGSIHRLKPAHSISPPQKWSIGYWLWDSYWNTAYVKESSAGGILDSLYVKFDGNGWPPSLPNAREYWFVWRAENRKAPDSSDLLRIPNDYEGLRAHRGNLAGVQVDYDCPTDELRQYAKFLKLLRKALPAQTRISITALLDWFRQGTEIAEVLSQVDEYVPQFYDVADQRSDDDARISQKIIPGRWAPVFNGYRVPYKIGISTFGRISRIRNGKSSFYRDVTPLDIMSNTALTFIRKKTNSAEELILSYSVNRRGQFRRYHDFDKQDAFEIIMPTSGGVYRAVDAAKAMQGYCAGIIFFRWPQSKETLLLTPDEVESALSGKSPTPVSDTMAIEEGNCVAVSCSDLYFKPGNRFANKPGHFEIHMKENVEYFLSEGSLNVKVSGPRTLEFAIPAYPIIPKIYLGRVVTQNATSFVLRSKP